MEIIIALVIIGVGLIWYFNNKAEERSIEAAKKAEEAETKVEVVNAAPIVEVAPAKKPAAKKAAPAKKPAAAKKTTTKAKAPVAKKTTKPKA